MQYRSESTSALDAPGAKSSSSTHLYSAIYVTNEQLVQSNVNIIPLVYKLLTREVDKIAPHGPVIIHREHDDIRYRECFWVTAKWKEPIQ